MATRIRLRRMGASKRPFYRVVVADQRDPRDGRFIEAIGKYHPLDDPSLIEIDEERALHWLNNGAQPSDTVRNLLDKVGIWERYAADHPKVRVKAEAKAKTDALKFERGKAAAEVAKQQAAKAEPPEAAPEPEAVDQAAPATETDQTAAAAAEEPPPAADASEESTPDAPSAEEPTPE